MQIVGIKISSNRWDRKYIPEPAITSPVLPDTKIEIPLQGSQNLNTIIFFMQGFKENIYYNFF